MSSPVALSMCCAGCGAGSVPVLGRDHTVTDVDGRQWLFEQHRIFGPIVLRKDGKPKSRQPGSRSKFWPAWYAWCDQERSAKAIKTTDPV